MIFAGDFAKFRTLLENLRYKSCTVENINFLCGRITSQSIVQLQWKNANFRNVSVIISFNASQDKLSERGADRFAKETGQTLSYFYSVDKYSSASSSTHISRKSQKSHIDPMRNTDWLHQEKHTSLFNTKLALMLLFNPFIS
jgi:hypothetical protein